MAAVQLMGEVFKLGDVISGERRKAGYKTAVEFAEAVERKTGMKIPKDTMQRIEAGRQEPKISQYIAIAITLNLLRDTMLVEAIPSEMRTRSIVANYSEYEAAHPGISGKTHRFLDDGHTVEYSMSDGRKVIVSDHAKPWEISASDVADGWGIF